ncbi:MAG: response regulator [Hydrogenophaga sp.]|jgi:two-component system chemotaxis response regulator CheY|uniref:response regulator n=1 Tax=Hydrogenophaga sp. TaxID=1904254 RepID=UPI002728F178|nr:response regulator [Hydrogenophaga sp.]MDO9200972.1 response regulator [Hydrogenophaga sp.]MDO9480579.1 response regulator [Hydrogenophaga sp.]MDO9568766.1 response regulator [Hydrogenophaga sp.]MDP1895981.1 response regulator [Hydrogenophaga sp.]MDP2095202.1 response regulator [Hydrogenophaga sp.]
MKLLIVDDSNLIRTRIASVVEATQMKGISIVGLARNGREAVRIARVSRPDVVTMDLTMPEMDGVETIRELMRMPDPPNILVVSALNDKSTAITALRMGARGFINKPFTDDELRLALLDVCNPN